MISLVAVLVFVQTISSSNINVVVPRFLTIVSKTIECEIFFFVNIFSAYYFFLLAHFCNSKFHCITSGAKSASLSINFGLS